MFIKDIILQKKLPNQNCFFIKDGMGHKLLKDIVVINLKTIVLEAILANRNLIIPNFNNESI